MTLQGGRPLSNGNVDDQLCNTTAWMYRLNSFNLALLVTVLSVWVCVHALCLDLYMHVYMCMETIDC